MINVDGLGCRRVEGGGSPEVIKRDCRDSDV